MSKRHLKLKSIVIISFFLAAIYFLPIDNGLSVPRNTNFAQENLITQKVNVLVLYDNTTGISPGNLSTLEGYLDDLGWVALDYKTEIRTYLDIQKYDLIIFLGYSNFTGISQFITDFILEGGSLLFLPPTQNLEEFNNYTKTFGVQLLDDIAIDNTSYIDENTTVLIEKSWETASPIFDKIDRLAFPSAHPITLNNIWNLTLEHESYKLVWGSNTTISSTLNGSDIVLLVGVEISSGTKILFYSTPLIALDNYINLGDNRLLLINSIKWLVGKTGFLIIDNVYISGNTVIKGVNSTIYINFTVKDPLGNLVDVKAQVYIVRLAEPLIVINATRISNGIYEANISLDSLESSTVELWIIVHKIYYGYYLWPDPSEGGYEITIYKAKRYQLLPDPITTILTIIVPILLVISLIIIWYPKYRKNRKLIDEVEGL